MKIDIPAHIKGIPAAPTNATPRTRRRHAAKLEAARAVGYRESLLMQVNAVVIHWPRDAASASSGEVPRGLASRSNRRTGRNGTSHAMVDKKDAHRQAEAARLLRNLSMELREAGLMCVEKVNLMDPTRRVQCDTLWAL